MTRTEVNALRRQHQDLKDPVRYMIVSQFGQNFTLYYNVSDDLYAMNNPKGGTLFKRRAAAARVKSLLGKHIAIIRVTTKGGRVKRLS